MISISDAFRKFRSRLELNDREQRDASNRQQEIRQVMAKKFKRETDFLTGSYKRYTKTRPLKDVDIFYVLHDDERAYRDKEPSVLLCDVEDVLAEEYGRDNVERQRRSVCVNFDVAGQEDRVMSFDVVPAFTKDDHYEIPDTVVSTGWTETDPKVHEEQATAAHAAFGKEWKGMVRMVKKWNTEHGKPVQPSFLLEVMALDLLRPPFNGDYPYEFKAFFASLAERIHDEWPDPAGYGPPVSDGMDIAAKNAAVSALRGAEEHARRSVRMAKSGRNGEALRVWRDDVFGDWFPLS